MKVMRVNHGKVFGSNHRYTFYFPNMAEYQHQKEIALNVEQKSTGVDRAKRLKNESNSSILNLLLREGGVVKDRGGRRNNVCSYFFINDRITHSPTTSPCGYSSFPKEEI